MTKEEITSKISEMENEIKTLKEELNKQEEPKKGRWKPELHGKNYCIDSTGTVCVVYWEDWVVDKRRYAIGNVFKTEEEAKFEVERLKVLAELKEYADDEQAWDGFNEHWTIILNTLSKEVRTFYNYNAFYDIPYFSTKEQAQIAIDAIGEERLKKYYFCVENDENTSNFSEACKQACMEADSHS